jgi:hypothetical protein
VHFDGDVLADTDVSVNLNTPRFWNIEASLQDTSSTVLLDTETGERVAHWAELDYAFGGRDSVQPDRQALLIWPAARLKSSARYIVGVRNLHNATGALVSSSRAFAELREGRATGWRVAAFKDIFSRLGSIGVPRDSSLQLAFDFTTASDATVIGPMVSARDDALRRYPDGAEVVITKVTDHVNENVARIVEGVMRTPLYLNQVTPGLSARLVLDSAGNPVYQVRDSRFRLAAVKTE